MKYLLDTCIVSELRRPRPDANALAWLSNRRPEDWYLSAVTIGELRSGARSAKEIAARMILAGSVGSAASLPTPCGDVWGEAKYAWTFDKDVNGDGILQTSEVRDMRYWGSTNVNGAAEGCILPDAISNDGEAQYWLMYDFHRLELLPTTGMALIFR